MEKFNFSEVKCGLLYMLLQSSPFPLNPMEYAVRITQLINGKYLKMKLGWVNLILNNPV